uniref:G-protein coupled receptors family 1 profile domain-containing protein n=1 Tax=Strongyloides stercoralis TaxID=6248 RepID=A0A0K0ER93_STRER
MFQKNFLLMDNQNKWKIYIRLMCLLLSIISAIIILIGPDFCVTGNTNNYASNTICTRFPVTRWDFSVAAPYFHILVISFTLLFSTMNIIEIFFKQSNITKLNFITIYLCVFSFSFSGTIEIFLFTNFLQNVSYPVDKSVDISIKVYGYLGAGICYFLVMILSTFDYVLLKKQCNY